MRIAIQLLTRQVTQLWFQTGRAVTRIEGSWTSILKAGLAMAIACFTLWTVGGFRAHFGFDEPYQYLGDQELLLASEALSVNSGEHLTSFDHPAYLPIVALATWMRIGSALGLDFVTNLKEFETRVSFGDAFRTMAYASKLLSLFFTALMVALFAWCVYAFTGRKSLALFGAYAFVAGRGIFIQSMMYRTELVAMVCLFAALALMMQSMRGRTLWTYGRIFLAGALVYCSMVSKVQMALLFAFFPLFALLYGSRERLPDRFFAHTTKLDPRTEKLVKIAIVWAVACLSTCFFRDLKYVSAQGFRPYHAFCVFWGGACTIAYAHFYGRSWRGALLALTSAFLGFLVGYLVNYIHFDTENHRAVMYFWDKLMGYCGIQPCTNTVVGRWGTVIWPAIRESLANKFLPDYWREYPYVATYWVLAALTIAQLKRQRYYSAMRGGFFLGMTLLLEIVFRFRWPENRQLSYVCYYYVLIEPFVLLGIATLANDIFGDGLETARAWIIMGVALVSLGIASGRANHAQYMLGWFPGLWLRQDYSYFCNLLGASRPTMKIVERKNACAYQLAIEDVQFERAR